MSTVLVHQTDAEGWYVGETIAQVSPLEPNVILMPAGACEDAPPPRDEWPEGCMPRRAGGTWVMQTVPPSSNVTPEQLLREFLAAHPEVVSAIKQGGV